MESIVIFIDTIKKIKNKICKINLEFKIFVSDKQNECEHKIISS